MRELSRSVLTFAPVLLFVTAMAQSSAQNSAQAAEVKADAQRFASEQYAAAEKGVADLRASYDKKDYKTVVTGAPAVQKQISDVRDTIAARRKELEAASARATAAWNSFADEMPRYIDTLQKKLDATKKRKSDKGAPSENALLLDNVKNLWADASNLFTTGKPVDATKRAEEARAAAQELAQKVNAKLE